MKLPRRGFLQLAAGAADVQEWIVRRSKLDWVIVRSVILTDGPKTNSSLSRSTMTPFCV
jgi:hypothetical protein